jgi:hypothetical protein
MTRLRASAAVTTLLIVSSASPAQEVPLTQPPASASASITAPSAPGQDSDVRFDVAVVDAPARAFFQGLADGAPYNMMVDPEVS